MSMIVTNRDGTIKTFIFHTYEEISLAVDVFMEENKYSGVVVESLQINRIYGEDCYLGTLVYRLDPFKINEEK